jgi:hypothetical protein
VDVADVDAGVDRLWRSLSHRGHCPRPG